MVKTSSGMRKEGNKAEASDTENGSDQILFALNVKKYSGVSLNYKYKPVKE